MSNEKKFQIIFFLFLTFLIFTSTVIIDSSNNKKNFDLVIENSQHRSNYTVVPLSINVVKGTNVNKADIEANIKKMNEIYNSEVVIFVWDGTINEIDDPSGAEDGKATSLDDRSEVRSDAEDNADGKGVSITISSDIGPNTNGRAIVGDAHGAIVKAGTDGSTWAHEMQHSLGQSHGAEQQADEDMDGDGNVDGDDTGWDANGDGVINPADRECNLWGRKSDREGDEIDCGAIFNASKEIPGVKVKERPAESVPVTPDSGKKTKKAGSITDPRGDQKNNTGVTREDVKPADIIKGGIIINFTSQLIRWWLESGGLPIEWPFLWSYCWLLDTNPGTGVPSGPYAGADWNITFSSLYGNMPELFEWDTTDWAIYGVPLSSDIEMLTETLDYDNSTGSGDNPDFSDALIWVQSTDSFFFTLLGLEPNFTMWITSKFYDTPNNDYISDDTNGTEIVAMNIADATITVSNDNITAGNNITINGTAFKPNATVNIRVDGRSIANITANASGVFSANVTIPSDIDKTNAILDAKDSDGNMDAVYVDINKKPTTTTPVPGYEMFMIILIISISIGYIDRKRRKNLKLI